MPKNKIQFQVGLSLPEFIREFGTEEKCVKYLENLKWPKGYICEDCQSQNKVLHVYRATMLFILTVSVKGHSIMCLCLCV